MTNQEAQVLLDEITALWLEMPEITRLRVTQAVKAVVEKGEEPNAQQLTRLMGIILTVGLTYLTLKEP